jgi:hypothetical protein
LIFGEGAAPPGAAPSFFVRLLFMRAFIRVNLFCAASVGVGTMEFVHATRASG